MNRVLILGGGFGGVATAITLRDHLPDEDEVILVDRRTHFMVGFRKTWAMLDIHPLEEGQRPLSALQSRGIKLVQGTVEQIEPEARAAVIDGERIEADALVVALGVRHAPEKVPGFSEHVLNAYAIADLKQVTQTLRDFSGGHVMVGIFGTPYQCPPAPFEIAILTREFFQKRGVDVSMEVFTPRPMTLPGAGREHSTRLEDRIRSFGIEFLPNRKVVSVSAGEVDFGDERRPFDLALGVPPHVVVDVIRESGLAAADGWVAVDRHTLETQWDGVYAIGDCTRIMLANGGQIPKAGLMAEKEGIVVAQRIAARLAGETPTTTFDGSGGCNIEVGGGEAALIEGNFFAEPAPDVSLSVMNATNFRDKHAFETSRLQEWFGS